MKRKHTILYNIHKTNMKRALGCCCLHYYCMSKIQIKYTFIEDEALRTVRSSQSED